MTSGEESSSAATSSFGCSKIFTETPHRRRRLTINDEDDDSVAENSSFFVGKLKNEEEENTTTKTIISSMNNSNVNNNNLCTDLCEEDIIDGFSFMSFVSHDELKKRFSTCDEQTNDASSTNTPPVISNSSKNNNTDDNVDKKKHTKRKNDSNKPKNLRVNNNVVMTEINGEKTDTENELVVSSSDASSSTKVKINNNNNSTTDNNNFAVVNKDASTSITPIQQSRSAGDTNNNHHQSNAGTKTGTFENVVSSSAGLANKRDGLESSSSLNKLNNVYVGGSDKCMAVKHKLQHDNNNVNVDDNGVLKKTKLSIDQETQVGIPSRILSPHSAHGSLTNGLPSSVLNASSRVVDSQPLTLSSSSKLTSVKRESIVQHCTDVAGPSSVSSTSSVITTTTAAMNGSSVLRTTPASSSFERKSANNFSVADQSPTAVSSASSSSYYHTEMHQHQHTHMHHYPPPMLPPFAVNVPVSNGSAAAVGLFGLSPCAPTLPTLPIIQPPSSTLRTAVVPGLSMPNFPPPPTPRKKGRWCGLHVQIAWDIYNRSKLKRDKPMAAPIVDHCLPTATTSVSKSTCFPSISSDHSGLAPPSSNVAATTNSSTSKIRTSATSLQCDKIIDPQSKNAGRTSQETKTEIRSSNTSSSSSLDARMRIDREKHANSVRSESRASVGTVIHDKERQPSLLMNNNSNVILEQQQQHLLTTGSIQDGLLYRQKELQEKLQQQTLAAALSIRPPFPPMIGVENNNPMISNMAAIQSQLNLLHGSSPTDLYRLRLSLPIAPPTPTMNGVGGRTATAADPAFRPPSNGLLPTTTLDNERSQQLQKQQQQQHTINLMQQRLQPTTSSAASVYLNPSNGTTPTLNPPNPLASLIDSERALNRTLSLMPNGFAAPTFPPLPGLFNGVGNVGVMDAGLPFADTPGALALYTSILQRERLELEQRSRMLGLMAAAAPQSLMSAEMVERLSGVYSATSMMMPSAADQLLAARNFAPRLPPPPPTQTLPVPMPPPTLNLNGLGGLSTQGATNKLNDSPFSLTLQQLARRGGGVVGGVDMLMNSLPTSTHNLQNS